MNPSNGTLQAETSPTPTPHQEGRWGIQEPEHREMIDWAGR
jgi:hypothetical protein